MRKATVYLPAELKRALETRNDRRPWPRLPLFKSGRRGLAERVDQALAGFGSK